MKSKLDYKETAINLKKTWKYASKNKKYLFGYLFTATLLSVTGALIPIISANVIINLSAGKFNDLLFFSVIVFVIEMTRNFIFFFADKMGQVFYRETLVALQVSIASETIKLHSSIIDSKSSGPFIDRLNKDTTDIAEVFNWINTLISEIFSNIGILIAIYIISFEMLIFYLITLTILFVLKRMRTQAWFARDKQFREISEINTGLITELVRGIKDIKLLNASDNFTEKVKEKFASTNKIRYGMSDVSRGYQLVTGITQDFLALMLIVFGIYLNGLGKLSIASFVIIYMYKSKIYNLLGTAAQVIEVLKRFNLSANRVFEIVDSSEYQKEVFGYKKLNKVKGDFEFKNVNFSYDDKSPIIKNLSFKVNANETVAFVGRSGSGKSTIFSLLTKLYDIKTGHITIDGVNINELDKNSIRGNISIITQNPYIFNFSIKDNLSIVKKNITKKEMIEACKLACIHDFIMGLPNKYDSVVGEGGILLSGGQRQRLAIARALLKKSEIILFDEATSALDNETQTNIQKAISNMKKDRTILIIAHRLSTIINSDRIILIDDGHVVDSGKHEELLERCKMYKNLYETELLTK